MEVYLDNSATTRCYTEVGELVYKVMCQDYGNPSSMHRKGVDAEHYIKDAKEILAKILKVNAKEIYFTSGGTESDNLAVIGTAKANKRRGNHLITSSIEHPAILNTMRYLEEEEGFRVTYLPVDSMGRIKLEALKEALCDETILVSVMYVNNEVGAVQPIDEAVRIVKEYNPDILFHSDAVQGFGKYKIYPKRQKIDLLTGSGHKIHGPKGVGFLYINSKAKVQPLILGGGQQNGMRSGTDNVPGIAGLGVASKMMYQNFDEKIEHLYQLKERMAKGLFKIDDVAINGMPVREGAPHILSVSFLGIRSEVLLHTLEDRNIFVSAGSACSSHKRKPSATLSAMGMSNAQIENTVRISFSEENTFEEVDYCLEVLNEVLPMLKRYARR